MKPRTFFIVFGILVFLLVGWLTLNYLKANNIILYHPFPKLTKQAPILRELDRFLCLSAGIHWYKVKHKLTGREYLFHLLGNGNIEIMDYEKRDEWILISQEEYLDNYTQPVYGRGFLNREEALEEK